MESSILKKAEAFILEKVRRKRWQKIVAVLAAFVILVTVWILLKPATATTKQTYCGLEEHTHTDDCYERTLICEKAGTEDSTGGGTSGGSSEDNASEDSSSEEKESGDSDTEGSGTTEPGTSTEGSGGTTDSTEPGTSTEGGTPDGSVTPDSGSQSGTSSDGTGTTPDNGGASSGGSENSSGSSDASSPSGDSSTGGDASGGGDASMGGDTSGGAAAGGDSAPAPSIDVAPAGDAAPADGGVSSLYNVPSADGQQTAQIVLARYLSDGTENTAPAAGTGSAAPEGGVGAATDPGMAGDGQGGGDLSAGTGEGHVHTAECYEKKLICEKEEHTHEAICYIDPALPQEDQDRILYAAGLIDALPEYEEIQETLAMYEEAGDEDGYQNYFMEIAWQAGTAYAYYEDLGILQTYIANSEKVLVLSSFWEATTLELVNGNDYAINAINMFPSSNTIVMLYGDGKTLSELGGRFTYWVTYFVNKEENLEEDIYVIGKMIPSDSDKSSEKVPDGGFVLGFNGSTIPATSLEGQYVKVNFDYKNCSGKAPNNSFGTITISSEYKAPEEKEVRNNGLTPIKSAKTADLIEINLYDYIYESSDFHINKKYQADVKYPGFRNPASYTASFKNDRGDSMNFGDLIVSDIDVKESGVDKGINATYLNANEPLQGAAHNGNLPISVQLDVMSKELVDGYPALADGTSLAYLFGGGTEAEARYVKRKNADGLDGLFLYDENTGWYTFNSCTNHAQFNEAENRFDLYDQVISSNFGIYPFGNFLPFNDIQQAMQASLVNKAYYEKMINDANYKKQYFPDGSPFKLQYDRLTKGLEAYVAELDGKKGVNKWTGADVVNDVFSNQPSWSDVKGFQPVTDKDIDYIYSIDFDDPTNFYFGMSMELDFIQPKDGIVIPPSAAGSGNTANGSVSEENKMKFRFAGDDDVWVYIDGVLVLDLSGIHRDVGGIIDFVEGKVDYYKLERSYYKPAQKEGNVDLEAEPVKTVWFTQIPGLNGKLNDKGTFQDNSTHTMNFYYMERGSGSGVCRMEFNFPLLEKNSFAVGKELSINNMEVEDLLGHPDFKFQVLEAKKNADGTMVKPDPAEEKYFVKEGDSYKVYREGKVCKRNEVEKDHVHTANCTLEVLACNNPEHKENDHTPDCRKTYADSGETREVDKNNVFSLKAGEYAVFSDISVVTNGYYVRELLEKELFEQYGEVYVSGETATEHHEIDMGGEKFEGMESGIKNIVEGDTLFSFSNQVDVTKLSKLSITKEVVDNSGWSTDTDEFEFKVKFGDEWVRAGTTYTVTSAPSTDNTITDNRAAEDSGNMETDESDSRTTAEDSETMEEETMEEDEAFAEGDTEEGENAETAGSSEDDEGVQTGNITTRTFKRGELDCTQDHEHVDSCYTGLLVLKRGETATLENILAGTSYYIQEVALEDYKIDYVIMTAPHEDYGPFIQTDENGREYIAGKVSVLNDHIQLKVINTNMSEVDPPMSRTIQIRKELKNSDGREHTYRFRLEQVADIDGKPFEEGDTQQNGYQQQEKEITISKGETGKEAFGLTYFANDYKYLAIGDSTQQYFKITEVIPENAEETDANGAFKTVFDRTTYIVEVTITRTAPKDIRVEYSKINRKGEDGTATIEVPEEPEADNILLNFTNAIEGDLMIGKWINGSVPKNEDFIFHITLTGSAIATGGGMSFPYTKGRIEDLQKTDGEAEEGIKPTETVQPEEAGKPASSTSIMFDENGVGQITLKSGEYIKIHGLPYGTKWKVEEQEPENGQKYHISYLLDSHLWTETEALHSSTRVEESTATGILVLPEESGGEEGEEKTKVNNAVTFVNTTSYALPETGSFPTTIVYTLAGVGLVLIACLLYRKKFKERRI